MSEHMPQQWFTQALDELHPRERAMPDGTRVVGQSALGPQLLAEALVSVLGTEGMTLAECREVMQFHGRERVDQALDIARADPRVSVSSERRPDRAGRLRAQVVLRRGSQS